jgi:uncharacterized membrane protein
VIIVTTVATAWLYTSLPNHIPTHWNIRGEVDGYRGKCTLFISVSLIKPFGELIGVRIACIEPKNMTGIGQRVCSLS